MLNTPEKAGMIYRSLIRQHTGGDLNARRAQHRETFARDAAIAIFKRRDNAGHSRRNQGIGTRRCLPMMRAGFQCHICCRTARRITGLRQSNCFGVRAPTRLGPAAPDNAGTLHKNASH
jgi:hypothetical protein